MGRNQRDSLGDFGAFNTEVTEMLRALRVEGLMVAEYTEPRLVVPMRCINLSALVHSQGCVWGWLLPPPHQLRDGVS